MRPLRMVHPRNAEALIDEGDFARDERLPYWAEIWPSAYTLARVLTGQLGEGEVRTALDALLRRSTETEA
jgi:hypothetical protein